MSARRPRGRARRVVGGVAYWTLVVIVSLAVVVVLLQVLEARDAPQVPERRPPATEPG